MSMVAGRVLQVEHVRAPRGRQRGRVTNLAKMLRGTTRWCGAGRARDWLGEQWRPIACGICPVGAAGSPCSPGSVLHVHMGAWLSDAADLSAGAWWLRGCGVTTLLIDNQSLSITEQS